eukprot:symbB.v1.2.027350.t1/scaffold2783.1/size70499/3
MDFARCPATSSVDWNFLRGEINAWSSKARDNAPMRWMVLCIFSNWIARIPKVWDGCLVGASLACLHASFCSEPGQQRSQLFQQVINGVSLQGWPGLVLEAGAADWPIFELVAAHGAVLKSGRWTGEDDLFLEPPECTKLTRGDDPIYWEASLVTMDRALDVVETGELYLEAPEIIFALNLLCSSQMVLNFASATACALKALAAPAELRSNLLSASERAAVGCLGKASMVTALLQSPWPLAHLLGRLRPKTAATAESQAASRQGLFWQPVALPLASSATTFEQSRDAAFPWVQFVARAVPPERLIMELPWPEVSDFLEMQREAIDLLSQFPVTNYPSPSNDRQTWKTLCLVCKDGLQDPQATEGTVYAKTEILPSAPALERFVDLFGKTGRVRLSVVLPGGMIAWHPDARVVEHGRLILHVPIKTNPGVLHWADYSIPHSVFNAGSEPRVHLIIDVVARDNAEFRRNFLQRMAPEVLEEFMANAMPPLDPTVTEASAVGPPGTSFARPLSRQMSDSFTALTGFPEMLDLERRIWQQVSEAYIAQALRCQAGGVCQEDQPNMPCRKAKDTSQ